MRFAYIDSHGNEVPIPSVDALALRIELGAIGPDTKLYDAQADRWGPASTHEIFHSLSRASESDGFVAPPPVAPPPPPPPAPAAKAPPKPKPKPQPKAAPPEPAPPADLGLTLAAPPPPPPPKPAPAPPAAAPFDLSLDLAPPMEPTPTPTPTADLGSPGDMGGTFDYGDLGSGLQLEDGPMDVGAGSSSMGMGAGPSMGGDAPMQFGGPPMGDSGDLQLERPMSEFSPDSPPGWMSGPEASDTLDLGAPPAPAPRAATASSATSAARPKREPKDRPPAPKFKSQRSLAGPIIAVVVLLALGVGGYQAWPLIQSRLNQPEAPVRPAMVMPPLPDELLPTMRALAEGAFADAIAEVDAATADPSGPAEPDQRWLGGQYLADAGQFPDVETFWTAVGAFVDGVRAGDWQLYHDKFVARASTQGIEAETAALLTERADSGLVASADARETAYATMGGLVEAALSLHQFLVANEANIEYRPANSSTADPILEAVPNSTALGDEMLERVDRVTEALADLGTLDRVTRERLTAALITRLGQIGIQ